MVCLTSISMEKRKCPTGCEVIRMGLFKRKKKSGKKEKVSVEEEKINILFSRFGWFRIVSGEDSRVRELENLLAEGLKNWKKIEELWYELMKPGTVVYSIREVGMEYRRLADIIGKDGEGRILKGRDIYVLAGVTDEDLFSGDVRFTPNGSGAIIPEHEIERRFTPNIMMLYHYDARGNLVSGRGYMFKK